MTNTAPKSVLALSILALASGCARAAAPVVAPTSSSGMDETSAATTPASDPAALSSESAPFAQKAGDFVVYRFSGDFRKTPLLLTQRVVEASDTALVVDATFDDGKNKRVVRARYIHVPGTSHELVGVWRIDASGAEKALSIAEFDKMMSETMLAADDNEGAIGSEHVAVAVGARTIDCTRTSYKVVVGNRAATMSTLTSEATPWGDVGGEIKAEDGKVLYRAEMIDTGGGGPILTVSR
jgi:hypothetical protein